MNLHFINRVLLPLRAELFAGGAHCSVHTNSERLLSSLSRWEYSSPGSPARSFELDVLMDSSITHDKRVPAHFRGLHHLVFASFGGGETFSFDLVRRKVLGVVSTDTCDDETFWSTVLLPIAIGVLGPAMGIVPLHSACLDREGKALMIAGGSGAGKSTLSLALAERGFGIVSDGWTYVAQEERGVTAYGLSTSVKLLPDAVRHFPQLAKFTPAKSLNGEMAFEVDAAQVFHSRILRESMPHWLMFLQRNEEAGCEFVPLTQAAAREFFESSVERLPPQVPQAAASRTAVIAAVTDRPCWLLRCGGPPRETAEAISRFCERS